MTKHHLSHTKEYQIWLNIQKKNIPLYEEWLDVYIFIKHIERLNHFGSQGYVFVRIDDKIPFEPGNVKFVKWSNMNANRCFPGPTGVRKRGNKYVARITVNQKEITIGSANTRDMAIQLRNEYIIINNLSHKLQKKEAPHPQSFSKTTK